MLGQVPYPLRSTTHAAVTLVVTGNQQPPESGFYERYIIYGELAEVCRAQLLEAFRRLPGEEVIVSPLRNWEQGRLVGLVQRTLPRLVP